MMMDNQMDTDVWDTSDYKKINLRDIRSEHINECVALFGVVSSKREIYSKVSVAAFECTRCGREYTVPQESDNVLISPPICECQRSSFKLVEEKSKYIDRHELVIRELPELSNTLGNEKLVLYIEGDLIHNVDIGDYIHVVGIVKTDRNHNDEYYMSVSPNDIKIKNNWYGIEITLEDKERTLELSKDTKIIDKITNSMCPEIYGNSEIKEAICLQMFGGKYKEIQQEGTKLRSDIHVLLVGNPCIGKSAMLRSATRIAPRAIYICGNNDTSLFINKGDKKREGFTQEIGPFGLVRDGCLVIDNFDKIKKGEMDIVYKAMEQQNVHLKNITFKTQTAILAAANPIGGTFDIYKGVTEQTDIPREVRSNFDLIFYIKDSGCETTNKNIAKHSKYYSTQTNSDIIDTHILKKYIAYARMNVNPIMTDSAERIINDFYQKTRKHIKKSVDTLFTSRQLEGLVRLAEASARARLSNSAEDEDAQRSVRLMKYTLNDIWDKQDTERINIHESSKGALDSQKDKISAVVMRKIYGIVSRLEAKEGIVVREKIIEDAEKENISKDEVTDSITKLKDRGDIFEPKVGGYKISRREY